jgi:FkbM family methyltransferase
MDWILNKLNRYVELWVYRYMDWRLQQSCRPHTPSVQPCGNYYVDANQVSPNDVVYSCGVGSNILFDEAIHQTFGCEVYMFDPTPIAIQYMDSYRCPALKFYPWGIWTEDRTMRFYYKFEQCDELQNLSVTNLLGTSKSLEFECYRLPTIMSKLSHDRIDILKMDIEGAAMPVLEDLLESPLRPKQLLFELEKGQTPLRSFHKRMNNLLNRLRADNYKLYFLPRSDKSRYNFDFLAVRSATHPTLEPA